jgi:WD40 repeat protein/serine/threonine protein kinase
MNDAEKNASDGSSLMSLADTVAPEALADTISPDALAYSVSHDVPLLGPGTVIKHYELIRELGAGGMGMVFLGRDTRLGRLVAIKFLLEHTGEGAQRFLVEARTTAQCRHENIVVIYDVDEINGFPYMVLEYIEGRTLRAAMSERGRDTTLAVDVMVPVVRALAYAHQMGIVHRDLKPENILLAHTGQVKVLDFGIAKQIAAQVNDSQTPTNVLPNQDLGLTQDGALVGTMPYMSPEQWRREPLDSGTDIWAAGIILYELAIGVHPIEPLSINNLIQVADVNRPMPSARDKLLGASALADVIDQCLQKHKEQRFGSAILLAEALEKLGADKHAPTLAEDESPFAGLAAFQESDAARFFGRDGDIDAMVGKLRNHQLVAIAGPSGVGKSSFVRAGVIPALKRAGRQLEAFVIRPGRRPLAALADVLAFFADTAVDADGLDESTTAAIADTLQTQPGYLGARLRARCRKRGNDHRILLFVDQLEELFTLGIDAAERAAFCACLEGVADDASSPLRVIVTIRADFMDRLADERRFLGAVTRGLLFLPPIDHDGLRDALKKPIEATRYQFEDEALVDEMLQSLDGTKSPLPILQFTATKLWEARDRENRRLTRAAYRALGGVAGALSTHADAVVAGLSTSEQRLARSIFLRLVTIERTRAIVQWDELRSVSEDISAVEQIVDVLADARLLSIERDNERAGKTVELMHESLIESWGKLRGWLDENVQDEQFLTELRNAASQWEKNGEGQGFLWRDRAAVEAGLWFTQRRKDHPGEASLGIGKREERYLEAVIRLMETARRRQRQGVAALIAGLSVVVLVVSTFAFQSKRAAERAEAETVEAQSQRAQAERNATRARNATRMAAAREKQHDPTTALALLREIEPESVPTGWNAFVSLARMSPVASVVLQHDSSVSSAAFSPDNKRIVTISFDKKARVWNADGMTEPVVLQDEVRGASGWSPDGKRLVFAMRDNTVRIVNADGTGQPIVLVGHEDRVTGVSFHPDGTRIVSNSYDKTVRVWNADGTGQPLVLRGHASFVNQAVWSPDGQRIASASDDNTIRVWNADGTGESLVLVGHNDRVRGVAWSPDGQHIVSGSSDKTIGVWNADGSEVPRFFKGHDNFVTAVAYHPDNTRIVSASGDTTVRVWNADGTGQPVILRGHDGSVYDVAFSPDGTRIISSSLDNTVRVWELNRSGQLRILQGHDDHVYDATFSSSGKRIVSAACDKTVRVWNADSSAHAIVLRGHEDRVYAASFSPDDQRIVSASRDRTVRVWNADGTGQPIVLQGHEGSVNAAAFSPDGKRIASGASDKTIRIWNADGSDKPLLLLGHEDRVFGVTWSPDGTRIASCSSDRTIRLWNTDGSGQPLVLRGHIEHVNGVAFTPDGKRILSAANDNTIRVWNADGSGQPLVIDAHHGNAVITSERPFRLDGRQFVASFADGVVLVFNTDGTGEPLELRGSTTIVNSASWSPDGQRIVGASDDNTVIVWSDIEPLQNASDARLWKPTTYCMPLEVRRTILDFPDEQSRHDLENCQRRVRELMGR